MGTIKSTLDLIMEKTRHLSPNEEEKKAFHRERLAQKIRLPVSRYLNGERDLDFLIREIADVPQEHRNEAEGICVDCFLQMITPLGNEERVLAGVERLLGAEERRRWEKAIASAMESYLTARERARAEGEARIRKTLAQAGLEGSALLVPPGRRESSGSGEELDDHFREALRTALGRS